MILQALTGKMRMLHLVIMFWIIMDAKCRIDKYNKLESENSGLRQQIKDGQLVFHYKEKNERGAGRKTTVTDEIKSQICKLSLSYWTMDQIAKKFKLSKGTIFNVIHNFEYFK